MTTTFAVQLLLLLCTTATLVLTEGNNFNADASDLGEVRWGLYSPDDRDLASLVTPWRPAESKRYLGAAMRLRGKKNLGSAMRLRGKKNLGSAMKWRGKKNLGSAMKWRGKKNMGSTMKWRGKKNLGSAMKWRGKKNLGSAMKWRGKKNMGSAMKWRGKKNLGSAMRLRYKRHVGMPWRWNQGAAIRKWKRSPEPESDYWTDYDDETGLTEQQVKRHLGAAMRLGGSHSHHSYYYRHPWGSSSYTKRYLGSAMRFRSLAASGNRMFPFGGKRSSADVDGDGGRSGDYLGQDY